jgi:hypothetical protein
LDADRDQNSELKHILAHCHAAARREALGDDIQEIAGTSLDKGFGLDAGENVA